MTDDERMTPAAAPRPVCHAPGCGRAAVARGLCHHHYKRGRAGHPLVTHGPRRGDPDGYGTYGVLDDDGTTVLCHECGARKAGLGAHVVTAHEMTAREYKLAHGLRLSRGLLSAASREALSQNARSRLGTPAWLRLEAARDPQLAADARTPVSFASIGAHADPQRAADTGRTSRLRRITACRVCQVMWCPLPGGYRTKTCSPECHAAWQAIALHPRRNAARDARIIAQVLRIGRPVDDVAVEYGITPTRVRQIVNRGHSGESR